MRAAERGIRAARRATVSVWDLSKEDGHCGQGLLLPASNDSAIVLTCHHVIAPVRQDDLCIRMPQDDGSLGDPFPVRYDSQRSRPERDAVVLRVNGIRPETRPLLHGLGLDSYDGSIRATVLTHMTPDNFDAEVRASTRLSLPSLASEAWPAPAGRYELQALRLSNPTDARSGISGGVVLCEEGVLGLVHFGRREGQAHAREAYLVPLNAWLGEWPLMEELIEPFTDANLRGVAEVRRASRLQVGTDVVMARFQEDVYLERGLKEQAEAALRRGDAVMVVGRPKSGKTRLAWEILQDRPEALVVVPHANTLPPAEFEASGWEDRDIVVLFDDLHRATDAQPLRWQRRLAENTRGSCHLICTTRDGGEWTLVQDKQETLLELLGSDKTVYTSKAGERGMERGQDLSEEQGRRLAAQLGIDDDEFTDRFDGTPGSLLLDLADMGRRYRALRSEDIAGVSATRLLDSAKLLHKGGQSDLSDRKLRLVAEQIRGESSIGTETWEALQRRTQEEGFGRFDIANALQIYQPYLEQCVWYEPSREDLSALVTVLDSLGDVYGLLQLGATYAYDFDQGARALTCVEKALELRADLPEGWFAKAVQLSDLQRNEAALEAYDEALRLRADWPEAWVNKGMVLNGLHRHDEAREAFERAIALNPDLPEAWLGKGVSLASIEHHLEAADAYQQAIDRRLEYPAAWHNRGVELGALGRFEEALQAYEVATHLRPDYVLAWYSKGNALSNLGRFDEAVRAYEQAVAEGYGHDHEAWLGKGNALAKSGRYFEAIKAYDTAIECNPDDYHEAWHQKGIALDESGSHQEALAAFDEALAICPDSATSLNSRGFVLLKLKRYAEALEAVDHALDSEGDSPEILSLRAAVLRELHRNREALVAVERAIRLNPVEPELWRQKSEVLFDLGRYDESREAHTYALFLRNRMGF